MIKDLFCLEQKQYINDLQSYMEHDVYFDESGDLGWILDQPYRQGGSSRYFTIAYIIIAPENNKHINRFLRKFNRERGSNKEFKGADFAKARAKNTAVKIINMLDLHNDIIIGSITVKKTATPIRLIGTGNDDVLYNHMVQIGICSKINGFTKINIIPDKRSVPAGSQNGCSDLIKNELWLVQRSTVEIEYSPEESHNNDRLMFIDWIANFVWRHYEDGDSGAYNVLGRKLQETKLFF